MLLVTTVWRSIQHWLALRLVVPVTVRGRLGQGSGLHCLVRLVVVKVVFWQVGGGAGLVSLLPAGHQARLGHGLHLIGVAVGRFVKVLPTEHADMAREVGAGLGQLESLKEVFPKLFGHKVVDQEVDG